MLNYLGQLRIYSLIDLIVLLVATRATLYEFIGVILLHIGFLAYLEIRHKHSYRKELPKYLWVIFTFLGLLFYQHIEGALFIIFSYFYTLKNKKPFGLFAPLMRGLQYFFLVSGIMGYNNKFIWIVLTLIIIRSFCGDWRDISRDKIENIKTLPITIELHRDFKYIHLILTLLTTFVWFQYTNYSSLLLIPIFLTQILTYNLTPRSTK